MVEREGLENALTNSRISNLHSNPEQSTAAIDTAASMLSAA